jgi:Xaa-Pro aminopeptidase
MIYTRISNLRKKLKKYNIDGYIIPKNDEFFSEYAVKDRLRVISNFSGSAGLAIILKKNNYLFVDGRYTIQAKQQSGNQFKIIESHKFLPKNVIKNLNLGFDPSLFTKKNLNLYFGKSLKLKSIKNNLVDEIYRNKNFKRKLFYSLSNKSVGES